jgi:hypothetical protein
MQEKKAQKFNLLVTAILLILPLTGCASKISLSKNSGPIAHPPTSGKRQLLADATVQQPKKEEPPPPPPQNNGPPPAVTGHWKLGFLAGTKNLTSTMDLTQNGNSFSGQGTDDGSNLAFTVEKGQITGSQVEFFKVYKNGKTPPVDYSGTFQNIKDANYTGPYLSGEYQVPVKGKTLSGQWEAEIVEENAPETPQPSQEGPPPQDQFAPPPPNHAPQLSGKWDVGFEYNFKVVHSDMYLEQDGGKIIGHGVDNNTKEKFVILKGWYKFPKITLIRKYVKKQGAASDREVTFKADVSWVSDKDYQGPYLKGKTQGGGDWEAQLQK